ncbi:MAG: hypothetical protein QM677_07645 [Microbacterium sp.]
MLTGRADVVDAVLQGRTAHRLMPDAADADAVRWHQDVAFAIVGGRAEEAAAAMSRIVAEADEAMQRAAVAD